MPLRSHMYSRALDRREASELHRGSRHTSQRAQHGGSKLDRAGMAESSFSKARMTHSTNVLYSTTHSSSMSPYTQGDKNAHQHGVRARPQPGGGAVPELTAPLPPVVRPLRLRRRQQRRRHQQHVPQKGALDGVPRPLLAVPAQQLPHQRVPRARVLQP
eukprot:1179059-Prorocentrum_minimum.AAC.3